MSDFKAFAAVVAKRFAIMCKTGDLYRTNVSADDLWEAYLAAFPAGTNPIFRERTEHDGSYDRSFIKRVGNLVAINDDGTVMTLWDDFDEVPYPYNDVAAALYSMIDAAEIISLFRTKEPNAGHKPNFEEINGRQHQWFHFYVDLPKFAVCREPGMEIGQVSTNIAVMKRGLEEITPGAVVDVLELIEQRALYRGDEFKTTVKTFQTAQKLYLKMDPYKRNLLLWANYKQGSLMIRNTAIGTLLVDLSEGTLMEDAVKSFEAKVAPINYKRTTALITPSMVQNAMDKIKDLGLEESLYRRHARLSDLNVNDVLWADASAKNIMAGSIGDVLMQAAVKKAPKTETAEEISIEDFMLSVVPKANAMELFVANKLQSNFVNITAAQDADAAPLFKWNNSFGWSYRGNVTDSIKENVKAAGGNINADLRISLAWHNSDDLDLHCYTPDHDHIFYGNRGYPRNILDVDMNAMGIRNAVNPVENLSFMAPKNGVYRIAVNQYNPRSDTQLRPGFTLQVEAKGQLYELFYAPAVKGNINAIEVTMNNGAIADLKVVNDKLTHQGQSQKVNGVNTESFVRVSTLMYSPNYWGDQAIGNKHFFFLLEGAKTDESVRGIYNEFLRSGLEEHRKVFEVLGAKTMVSPDDEQLAGLGFSSTIRAEALVKISGPTINKTYKVKF